MKILVSGASGFLGESLQNSLRKNGHEVIRLVRTRDASSDDSVYWNPEKGEIERSKLEGLDAVIHLAGEPVVGRWTESKKVRIYDSRVAGTRLLVDALMHLEAPPKTFLSASAIGYYGDTGDDCVDEKSKKGEGFLANVVADWEAASAPLREKGIRLAHMRIGLVLSPKGGALQRMLLPFKLGLGGRLGPGTQWMSWIALDDLRGAFMHVLNMESLEGVFNAVAPKPITNSKFTKALGSILRRPTIFPVPAFVLRFLFGEMADTLFLGSSRVKPSRLIKGGYTFKYPTITEAFEHLLK